MKIKLIKILKSTIDNKFFTFYIIYYGIIQLQVKRFGIQSSRREKYF